MMKPELIAFEGKLGTFITMPDGTVFSFYILGKNIYDWQDTTIAQRLYFRRSHDCGMTWGEQELAWEFAAQPGSIKMADLDLGAIVDPEGTIHIYCFNLLDWDKETPYRERTIEMLHLYSKDQGTTWEGPVLIDYGHRYTGSLNALIQLKSGRMVMPFSYLSDRETGCFVGEVILSDDNGYTWRNAKADIVIDNGGKALESGATEPIAVQLPDGRVWMIIRTQTGRFFECYSSDEGETWTKPEPTAFFSSNAPGGFVQLPGDRIMMVWNHSRCEPIYHGISYSRQSLVAAIREQDGTWSGYREIVHLDAAEHDENHAVCYPWINLMRDGKALVGYLSVHLRDWHGTVSFQMVRVDPDWVTADEVREDWSNGLADASHTASGVSIHGEQGGGVLHMQSASGEAPAGLTRNFPLSQEGQLTLKLHLEEGFAGAYITLSETFMRPQDLQGGMYRLKLDADGSILVQYMNEGPYQPLRTQAKLPVVADTELTLVWECGYEQTKIVVDGEQVGVIPQLEQGKAISFVRLFMNEAGGGLLVRELLAKKK